jgi:hypothetical protein
MIQEDPVEQAIRRKVKSEELQSWYINLWHRFKDANLADPDFESQIAPSKKGGDQENFESRMWEIVLACRLMEEGHELLSNCKGQPDLCIKNGNLRIWVEAISPKPNSTATDKSKDKDKDIIPESFLNPKENCGYRVPHKEILLRYTSAIGEKFRKLTGYLTSKSVKEEDAYIIAVDPKQLGSYTQGISQFPYILEAVLPIGHLEMRINRNTVKSEGLYQSVRPKIHKKNTSPVPTNIFLNPDYARISAVISSPSYFEMSCPMNSMITVVHNPFAVNKIPMGLFGRNSIEYLTKDLGNDEYRIEKIPNALN